MGSARPGQFDVTEFINKKPRGIEITRFRNNTPVFLQGDKNNGLFLIFRGQVKLTAVSSRGKQAVVAVLRDGDFLGEECLTSSEFRLTTATTASESSLIRIPAEALEHLLSRNPNFARFLVQSVALRCIRSQQNLINALFLSAEKRLSQALVSLAQLENDRNIEGVTLKVSQQELAEMAGATRTRVNQLMNKFRSLGLIDYGDFITVHEALRDFANQD